MLTGKQRAFLRTKANKLDAVFQIGKGGVSENLLLALDAALAAHEMVKVKCLENCEYTPREACDGIAEALGAEGVQCIGNKFVLFKISPEHRKYDLLHLCEIEEKKESAPAGGNAAKKTERKRAGAPARSAGKSVKDQKKTTAQEARAAGKSAKDMKKPAAGEAHRRTGATGHGATHAASAPKRHNYTVTGRRK